MAPSNSKVAKTPQQQQQQQRSISSFFTPQPTSAKLKKPLLLLSSSPDTPRLSLTNNPEQARHTHESPASPPANTPLSAPLSHSQSSKQAVELINSELSTHHSVIGRRLRVYWPLDDTWYEGSVKDYTSPNHLIQYNDGDEEVLCLENEKVEWISSEKPARRRKLRKLSFLKEPSYVQAEDCLQGNGGIGRRRSKRSHGSEAGICIVEEDGINENNSEQNMDDDDDDDDDDYDAKSAMKVEDDSDELDFNENEDAKAKKRKKNVKHETKNSTKTTLTPPFGKPNAQNQSVPKRKGSKSVPDEPTVMEATHSVHEQPNGSFGNIHVRLSGEAAERFGLRDAEKFKFLDKDRKDASGNRPGDPDYNPRTLFLPTEFLKGLSAGQRQWWEFKSKHMDKVALFKMGKFYEMFEMDAHVGAQCLDLQYMKGAQPHCGFPEKNFEENAGKLAKMGYRVLVVEQVETPGQLEERNMKSGTKDKVVKREICGIITKGIITEGAMLTCSPDAAYLMATFEISNEESLNGSSIIGLCFLDAATSRFLVGQCSDDLARSRLRSILSELRPVELVKPTGLLSLATEKVLKEETRNPLVTNLTPGLEFWDAERTINEVVKFFGEKSVKNCGNVDDLPGYEDGLQTLPEFLHKLAQTGAKAKAAISALGGCISYLRQSLLDRQLLGSGRFELLPGSDSILEPPFEHGSNFDSSKKEDNTFLPKIFADSPEPYMVLDSSALENLDILESSHDGSTQGTLLAQLDHCVTAFGRRLLRQWLVRPLICVDSIVDRQNAIEDIKGVAADAASKFRKDLLKLPDMERLVVRLKSYNEKTGRNAHAVVLYEDAARKLLREFLGALRGFQIVMEVLSSFSKVSSKFQSRRLQSLFTLGGGVQDMAHILKYFENAFDWLDAEKSGRITPHEGVDAEFDLRSENVATVESKLEAYLNEQKEYFKNQCIAFVTVGKDRFQLQIPDSLQKKVPPDYSVESQRKGFRRYSTPIVKQLLADLVLEEEQKEAALKNILQGLLARFGENYSLWLFLVRLIAELDALISLTLASNSIVGATCKPVISNINNSLDSSIPFLLAKGLRHPILEHRLDGGRFFVPNDINLGGKRHAPFMLLTGPNMGGKSTLLRQVCLAIILAQVGASVPAEDFCFSPIDRVFVRMGAKDHIMAAQSTFLVELLETSCMLTSATPRSLVALDELGRGTATSDGQAIAHAVLEHLAHKVGCLGMFSTHYHRLSNVYKNDSMVALYHMACKVEDDNAVEKVTFLYKLARGACPKSYGVNVARIAGMPELVLRRAAVRSAEMERLESTQALKGHEEQLFVEALQVARKGDCADLGVITNLRDRWRLLHAMEIPVFQKC